ncbi:MAG: Extracellular solute-binding protein family 5 [Parcubacteria group bacterium GW2011_GWA2_50_10b]|nr:MAG: Extracellular solute-binding protein family 5 [Parcubacteria group bacterium GW2011_GWA2_50_10b]
MTIKALRALLLRRFNIPKERAVKRTLRSFTMAEKTVFYFCAALFLFSGFILIWKASDAFMVEVPIQGGTLSEGVVGNPRFINPVLALSEADKNLSSLIYSGLIRLTPDGSVENDLAESLAISENRLIYTVAVKPGARFHDGTAVTADDVIFTIQKIVDPGIKSPKRGNWDAVSVEKVDESTVAFKLKKPYAPFIYNLTIGILPKNIWKNVSDDEFSFSQFNTLPIGSGPYEVERVERNSGGIPDYYQLVPFKDASGKEAYIKNMIFRFYPSEEALINAYNDREIDAVGGISPERIADFDTRGVSIIHSPLPRIFAVFFNQSHSKVLLNKEVRQALELSTPKEEIIAKVLKGYGAAIDGPMPAGIYSWSADRKNDSDFEERLTQAKEILAKAGWKLNEQTGVLEKKSGSATIPLSFSISTGDAPELRQVADELVAAWRKLGAQVLVSVSETGDLNQNVIRPRQFDALLFGEVVGRDADLYPFWHSSQRNDPGLNIALYANARADKFLEEARSGKDEETIEKNYRAFQGEIASDVPAVFLYTPSFLYLVPEKVKAVALGPLSVSQDRFLGIRDWYIETDKVWKIFLD